MQWVELVQKWVEVEVKFALTQEHKVDRLWEEEEEVLLWVEPALK